MVRLMQESELPRQLGTPKESTDTRLGLGHVGDDSAETGTGSRETGTGSRDTDVGARDIDEALVHALLRASGNLLSEVARPLAEVDLTTGQYEILRILGDGPADGLETQQVARSMVSRAPNATRLVDRLESRGLVRRVRCSRDRRVVWLKLTDEGREIMHRLIDPIRRAVRAATVPLDASERLQLCSLLERLQHLETSEESVAPNPNPREQ